MLKRKPKTTTQKMRAQADEVMERLAPHVESARGKAAPYVAEARDKATPVVDGAKTKFAAEVLPVITAAVAATEEAREEAKKRGAATAAALKGELDAPRSKDSHKLRNFLVLIGLGSLAAFVAKKMSDREASTAWQSSYTPTSTGADSGTASSPSYSAPGVAAAGGPDLDDTPMGTAAAVAAAQKPHDEGGAGPDEAAADANEEPHPATTPDNPVEEVTVDEDR